MALVNEGAQARERSTHSQSYTNSVCQSMSNQMHFSNTLKSGNCIIFHGLSSRSMETSCLGAMLVPLQLYSSLPSAGTQDAIGFKSATNSAQC